MTTSLRTVIVDDEPLARRGMRLRLGRYAEINLIAECENGRQAVEVILSERPDLVFLDIQMPGMSGFDVIQRLQSDEMPLIVFVTAYDHYAVNAFEVCAVDYVLKPVEDDRLRTAVERAVERYRLQTDSTDKQRLIECIMRLGGDPVTAVEQSLGAAVIEPGERYPRRLAIRDGSVVQLVPVAEIDWVDAAGDYMCVHARGVTHIMRSTMKELEVMLDPACFSRIHRSTLVNINRVTKVKAMENGKYQILLDCGEQLVMSRSYRELLQQLAPS